MGYHKGPLFTAAFLVLQGCGVLGQLLGGSEFTNQGSTQSVATSTATAATTTAATGASISSGGQFVIPAIIKPIFYPEPYAQTAPSTPNFGTYAPAFSPALPPVIISDDGGDNMNHLLFFLLFAMNRRGSGGSGHGSSCGGGCNGGCGCGDSYGYDSYGKGNCRCGNTGYSNNYMPYPIPIPFNSGYYANGQNTGINGAPFFDTSCGCTYGDEVSVIQNPGIQPCNGQMPNEISLIIRADPCNCSSR